MNIAQIIDSVLVTEKTNFLNEKNKSVTVVTSSCRVTKADVRRVMQAMFPKVRVKKIRSLAMHPKSKVFKGRKGVRVKRKKIIISFYEKDGLSLISGV